MGPPAASALLAVGSALGHAEGHFLQALAPLGAGAPFKADHGCLAWCLPAASQTLDAAVSLAAQGHEYKSTP